MGKIKDIHKGKIISVCEDDEMIIISSNFNGISLSMTKDNYKLLKDDFKELFENEFGESDLEREEIEKILKNNLVQIK